MQEQNRAEELLELVDEEGSKHYFQIIDVLEVDEEEYVVCAPEDQDEDEEHKEAFVFRIDEEDGKTYLEEIEDDDEFSKVASTWRKKVES